MITIDLTNEEAILFRKFREYQDLFTILLDSGTFETANGQVILNFNEGQTLTHINKNVVTYKKPMQVVAIRLKGVL